jgi:hypothetical protein
MGSEQPSLRGIADMRKRCRSAPPGATRPRMRSEPSPNAFPLMDSETPGLAPNHFLSPPRRGKFPLRSFVPQSLAFYDGLFNGLERNSAF